ncbi:hypothetical protein PFISCL1PPCAC_1672 [Pristionchus fissidentatus]|uniref:G protein-coupled receptor n=1 Tax=Pristionchus fissidentatus TaxID=1538716 RepID=A0AAV5UW40_9BILA|nr:hypothetical protein PFISCL1PPCAC_1672 [Pristionchus fissidentatus]
MQFNYLIWVPQVAFTRNPALYTSFYVFEIVMIALQIIAEPFILCRMYRTRPLHLNIRLIIVHCFSSTGLSSLSRLVLLYFQYFGIPKEGSGNQTILLLASFGREVGLGALVSIPLCIAVERMIATRHWSWYEKESIETVWVFIVIQICSTFVALLNAVCFIYAADYYRHFAVALFDIFVEG